MEIDRRHGAALPSELSMSGDKLDLYATDTNFLESWEDLLAVRRQRPLPPTSQFAALTLKPDAVVGRTLMPTIDWLEENGFAIVAAELLVFDRHLIRGIWQYSWNVASRDRKDLVDVLLAATPSLFLALRGPEDASVWLSRNKGPANPVERKPGQLRSRLGDFSTLLNFVHTSDEPADFIRELGVYFPAAHRRNIYRAMDRGGSTEAAERLARRLEAEHPAHDLGLGSSLERIRAAARSANGTVGRDRARLVTLLADIEAGRRRDWRLLFRLCEEAEVGCDRWDLITVATHLVGHDEADLDPVLPGVSTMSSTPAAGLKV